MDKNGYVELNNHFGNYDVVIITGLDVNFVNIYIL